MSEEAHSYVVRIDHALPATLHIIPQHPPYPLRAARCPLPLPPSPLASSSPDQSLPAIPPARCALRSARTDSVHLCYQHPSQDPTPQEAADRFVEFFLDRLDTRQTYRGGSAGALHGHIFGQSGLTSATLMCSLPRRIRRPTSARLLLSTGGPHTSPTAVEMFLYTQYSLLRLHYLDGISPHSYDCSLRNYFFLGHSGCH